MIYKRFIKEARKDGFDHYEEEFLLDDLIECLENSKTIEEAIDNVMEIADEKVEDREMHGGMINLMAMCESRDWLMKHICRPLYNINKLPKLKRLIKKLKKEALYSEEIELYNVLLREFKNPEDIGKSIQETFNHVYYALLDVEADHKKWEYAREELISNIPKILAVFEMEIIDVNKYSYTFRFRPMSFSLHNKIDYNCVNGYLTVECKPIIPLF